MRVFEGHEDGFFKESLCFVKSNDVMESDIWIIVNDFSLNCHCEFFEFRAVRIVRQGLNDSVFEELIDLIYFIFLQVFNILSFQHKSVNLVILFLFVRWSCHLCWWFFLIKHSSLGCRCDLLILLRQLLVSLLSCTVDLGQINFRFFGVNLVCI